MRIAAVAARNRLLFAISLAALAAVFAAQAIALAQHRLLFGDFHAFYCGGSAVLRGWDPYAASALDACEHAAQPFGLYSASAGMVAPVPFPGYAFAVFTPFALLPYVASASLWCALMLAAAVYAAAQLARITQRPAWTMLALLTVPYGVAILAFGEVTSIVLCALCACAVDLRAGRVVRASIWLGVASILPNVAAPAFMAVFLWHARARIGLACVVAALAVLDVLVGGPGTAMAYFTRVLPAHAQSEIGYIAQYGITWALHALGAPDELSLRIGEASFAVWVAAGVWCAGVLGRRFADDALFVLIPAGFAVVCAPFMHYSEITLALPGIVTLYSRSARPAFGLALLLVCVPWQWVVPQAALVLPLCVAAIAITGFAVLEWIPERALAAAAITAVGCGALLFVALRAGPQVQQLQTAPIDPSLAQSSWAHYIRSQDASSGVTWWLAKAPTWAGLWMFALCGLHVAAQKDLEFRVAVKAPPPGTAS
jgi:hypothetical protein